MKEFVSLSDCFSERRFRLARKWSNRMLAAVAGHFAGDVINVSAWEDQDKEGHFYREYFPHARSYSVSNYGGERGQSAATDYVIDLEAELPLELRERFDVVFNHTTLEHIFAVNLAVKNLCCLSRDLVVVVVPYVQEVHVSASFSDYWRFTHLGLQRMFEQNGFGVAVLLSSPFRRSSVYHFCVASRQPEKWRGRFATLAGAVNEGEHLVCTSRVQRIVLGLRDWWSVNRSRRRWRT